jgi:hypothetical protein
MDQIKGALSEPHVRWIRLAVKNAVKQSRELIHASGNGSSREASSSYLIITGSAHFAGPVAAPRNSRAGV